MIKSTIALVVMVFVLGVTALFCGIEIIQHTLMWSLSFLLGCFVTWYGLCFVLGGVVILFAFREIEQ